MTRSGWNNSQIPDQSGKVVLVTGATSGLGKEAARVLAQKNAKVIMAVRDTDKGTLISEEIRNEYAKAQILVKKMDLTSLESVRHFAEDVLNEFERLDILINNAGVMMCPYKKTEDGFEIQMGTNHLGHFALTGILMPLLRKTDGSRIVATSSSAHIFGNIDFDDINWEKRRYKKQKAYGDSKIANLYFTYELARRLEGSTGQPMVTVAHPGWTSTELQRHSRLFMFLNNIFGQDVEIGTLPTLRAAVDPEVKPGDYFGPSRFFEMHGHPVKVSSNKRSHDERKARQLWDISEKLTGVKY